MTGFLDPVDLRVVHDGGSIVFEVLNGFTFFHPEGEIRVDAGFITKAAHSPFSSPMDFGCCLRAGILHDYMRRSMDYENSDADRIFCDALKACGMRPEVVRQTFATLTATRYLGKEPHND